VSASCCVLAGCLRHPQQARFPLHMLYSPYESQHGEVRWNLRLQLPRSCHRRAPFSAFLGRRPVPSPDDSNHTIERTAAFLQRRLTAGVRRESAQLPRSSPRAVLLASLASTSHRGGVMPDVDSVDSSPSSCWFCGDGMDKKRQFFCDNCSYLQSPHPDTTFFQLFSMCAAVSALYT
jgi:hypothetical protein